MSEVPISGGVQTALPSALVVDTEDKKQEVGVQQNMPANRFPEDLDVDKLAEAALAILSLTLHDNGRVWKGLDWDLMDLLEEKGWLLEARSRAKSVVLTEEGERVASESLQRHFGRGTRGAARGANAGDAAAVARTSTALLNAVNASDVDGVLALWSDGGVLMPPHHASVQGRSAIEQYFRELFRRYRLSFTFTASRIHVSGDLAVERVEYVSSAWPVDGGQAREDAGKGVHLYQRAGDESWKLIMDIWNSDNPAALPS